MDSPQILVVEDDKHIAKLTTYNLEKEGFDCTPALTGEQALEILDRQRIDMVLLDIMLPKINGLEVCKRMRSDEKLKSIPIIIVTAKGEETDRVIGFELGANDYIVKPFSVRELILRVKSLLKKQQPDDAEKDKLKAGDIAIDISRYKVFADNKPITLTNMEFKLLVTLMRRKGRVQSRETLLEQVWDIHSEALTRTVDTHIKHLRGKLKKSGKYIETVWGVGYRFSDESEE